MDGVIRFVAGARKKIDGCLDKTRPSLATRIEPLKRSLIDAKRKGIRFRYVTEITHDNLSSCKELMNVAADEIRHLDGIKGTFYLSDTEYIAPATFHQKGKPVSQMIYSNVREIVGHQQYIFDTFWNKAIPAQLKIKEIEEGLVPDFIDTIKDLQKNQQLAFELIKSVKKEILIIFSTANAFLRQQKAGAIESVVQQARHPSQ
jgi:hypothetical protein